MATARKSLTHAPFTTGGSLHHYVACRSAEDHAQEDEYARCINVVWLPNDPFIATLEITHMTRGYSAKYVNWMSPHADDDRVYPMFVTDLLDLMRNVDRIERGIVTTRWKVRKRGQNYGLCAAQ